MKKLIIIFFLLMVSASVVFALTWHVADSWTVKWDAVTADIEGNEFAEGEIEYSVIYAPVDKEFPIELWRGTETQALVTISAQGQFLLGVIAHRMVDGEEVAKSDIAWSDDPEAVGEPGVWGVMRFLPPAKVGGFQKG